MNLQLHHLKQIIQYLIYLPNQLSLFQGFFPTSDLIFQLAKEGDRFALEIFHKLGRILGIGIADLINILNIELFVLVGGVVDSWDYFIDSAIDEIKKRTYRITGERVKVVKAELGDDAGTFGAAYMAKNKIR